MTLSATKYTSKYTDCDLNQKLWNIINKEIYGNIGSVEIKVDCGYWRKSNQIHNWFVENCQEGKDDCGHYDVSRKQLIELKELCEKVIKILSEQKRNKVVLKDKFSKEKYEHEIYKDTEEIEELLPIKEGFFFGCYEYDGDYLDDIESTIEIVTKCLENYDEDWEFSYHSSW